MNQKPKDEQLQPARFNMSEAAQIANCSRLALVKAVQRGDLRAYRTWERGHPYIMREDLEDWMRAVPVHEVEQQ